MKDIHGNPIKVLYGTDAIARVEALENRTLSPIERRVVREEGFVDGLYYDGKPTASFPKGVPTYGVGQTGEYIQKGFKASFDEHVSRAEGRVPNLRNLPEFLQEELVQAEYRGDLGQSPTAVKHINNEQWRKAAVEFLDNKEYRDPKTKKGVKARMKSVSDALMTFYKQVNHGP